MRPSIVLWARKALLAKDASIAKARKVSELNKGPWKVLYELVKNETQNFLGDRVRPIDVAEQSRIIQDIAPVLAAKKVPTVDEAILQWAVQRTESAWRKGELREMKTAREKWHSYIKTPQIHGKAPWNKLRANLASIMEAHPTPPWKEMSNAQREDLKSALNDMCIEQGLPKVQMVLLKPMVVRWHEGILFKENDARAEVSERSKFSKRAPKTHNNELARFIRKLPTGPPADISFGDDESKSAEKEPTERLLFGKTHVDARLDMVSAKDAEALGFIHKHRVFEKEAPTRSLIRKHPVVGLTALMEEVDKKRRTRK